MQHRLKNVCRKSFTFLSIMENEKYLKHSEPIIYDFLSVSEGMFQLKNQMIKYFKTTRMI